MNHKKLDLLVLSAVENTEEILSHITSPINYTIGKYSRMECHFKDNTISLIHEGKDLKDYSFVWMSSFWNSRDLAFTVKKYLDHHNIPSTYAEGSTSKLTDQFHFVLNKIPTPDTFFIDRKNITRYVTAIENTCGFPLIIKDVKGSRGASSIYVESKGDLLQKLASLPKGKKYFFQKFIPNKYDWGIIVANGKAVSAEKSYPQANEFRNNTCNGAKEVFVDIKDVPQNVIDIAERASASLDLVWSRSDIIIDENTENPYLLEVNRCPGISLGSTEVSGAVSFLNATLETAFG